MIIDLDSASPVADITAIVLVGSGRSLELLARCLDSIDRQTVRVQEILVVLNGVVSSEEVKRLCDRHNANTLVLPEDRGCPEGRNAGARAANNAVLFFVDDDGRLDVGAVAKVLTTMKNRPCAAVAGRVVESEEDEHQDGSCPEQQPHRSTSAPPTAYFSGGIFAIRREVFLRYDGYWKDSRRQGEELDLALKLFKHGEVIVYDVGFILYHPIRPAAPSSLISIASSASGTRAFCTHFPLPIAFAAYTWKLGRHAFWLMSQREPGISQLISAITAAAIRGWSERTPMTFRQAMRFRRLAQHSPNIAATRFNLRGAVRARFPRRPLSRSRR